MTRRAASETTIRHGVEVDLVRAAEIQPVWPLGRPGSRTRSQASSRPPWPRTGSTVALRVSGRRAATTSMRPPSAFGARRATWSPSSTTKACGGAERTAVGIAERTDAGRATAADDAAAPATPAPPIASTARPATNPWRTPRVRGRGRRSVIR